VDGLGDALVDEVDGDGDALVDEEDGEGDEEEDDADGEDDEDADLLGCGDDVVGLAVGDADGPRVGATDGLTNFDRDGVR